MYLVGQMAGGYIFGRSIARPLKTKVTAPVLLFCGTISDADVGLKLFGIEHATWTHSLVVLGIVFLIPLAIWKRRSIPYLVAVVQESAFGDTLIGSDPWFFPLSTKKYGLNIPYGSDFDVAVETLLLAGFVIFAVLNGDFKDMFSATNYKANLTSLFPFLATFAGLVFFSFFGKDIFAKYVLLALYYFLLLTMFFSFALSLSYLLNMKFGRRNKGSANR
jgi:hypothetical protein